MGVAIGISFLSHLGAGGTSPFGIQIYVRAKLLKYFSQKVVEINSPEVFGSHSEKYARNKNGVIILQGKKPGKVLRRCMLSD